jgi:hypothetical protein
MFAERILSNLPWITILWTSLSLCWGLYIGVTYTAMLHWNYTHQKQIRIYDVPHLIVIYAVNTFLMLYLWSDSVLALVGGAIIVINVFYTTLLVETTFEIIRWAKVQLAKTVLHIH